MEGEKAAQEERGSRERAEEDRPEARMRKCKQKECEETFRTKKELNVHMVSTHNYLRCLLCSKVFKLQRRLDKHRLAHSQPFPLQAPSLLRIQPTPMVYAENVQEITRAAVEYLKSTRKLVGQDENKGLIFAQMTSRLISEMTLQAGTDHSLALYMHALDVALSFPVPFSSPSPTTVDLNSSSAAYSSQESRDMAKTDKSPECEKEGNSEEIGEGNEEIASEEHVPISVSISLTSLIEPPSKPVVRGKGLLFNLHEKEIRRKRRQRERSRKEDREADRQKRRKTQKLVPLPIPEAQILPFPPHSLLDNEHLAGPVSLICIEPPCSLCFGTPRDLLVHLETVHYNYKPCN